MASDLNRVVLIGRLTRDPELRHTQAGTSIASFSIANNRNYSVQGEKREEVSFFNCIAWGRLGEVIVEYSRKGHRIAVEGRLQQRSWEDQEGKKRSIVEVVVENMQFLQSRGESTGQGGDYGSSGSSSESGSREGDSVPDFKNTSNIADNPFSDDDIPF